MPILTIPDFKERRCYVYALLCQDGDGPGYIKFGRSQSIGSRLTALRTSCPIPVHYFAIIEVSGPAKMKELERDLHQFFADRRVRGEWFAFDFSSKADKVAFNEGCRHVFQLALGRNHEWWTKISVKALDEYNRNRRRQFMRSRYRRKLMRQQKQERDRRKAWKELDAWGKTG